MKNLLGEDIKDSDLFNPWRRKGIFYRVDWYLYRGGTLVGTYSKKLDFLSYHMIKFFHGNKKLISMAYDLKLMDP